MESLRKFIRKFFIAIAGGLVIIIGVIMLPLPGPGTLIIATGVFILSLEFKWAERYYKKLERFAKDFFKRIKSGR